MARATVPYTLVDGTVVASDFTGLTSGTLLHGIDITELGTKALGGTATDCFFGGSGFSCGPTPTATAASGTTTP
jgi:hypothetical protein